MAKKFGKFLAFTALVGAAAAGVYYYLNREESSEDSTSDFAQDVDNFFENKKAREYVSLNNVASDESKEALKNAAMQAAEELKDNAWNTEESSGIIRDDSAEAADFAFKEFKDEETPLE